MRVLTVREPWLWAIVSGGKNIENRSPRIASVARVGERIGLHGSTTWSKRGRNDQRVQQAYARLGLGFMPRPERIAGKHLVHPVCDGFGLIVATAVIDDVHQDADCCRPWGESEYRNSDGHMVRGVTHLVLADVQLLDPVIPARGQLGFWNSPDLEEAAKEFA